MTNYNFPNQVLKALALLEQNNYEAVVVGGAVRDLFLNKEPHDYDIATNATVEQMYEIFKEYKVIDTGLKHGTLTIHLDHFPLEITAYRGSTNTLKEDLFLRDFTFNSMAMNKRYELFDFYNGKEDLENKIVRCNNDETFKNDPLRILRAIRQAGKYNFVIEEKTKELMNRDVQLLNKVSKERISSELSQILMCDNAHNLIKENSNIITTIIPELKETIGFNQNNPHHIYDVFNHTLKVLENTPKILELRLAALLHDIGKVKCYEEDENHIGHFLGHHEISKVMAFDILKRLKYDNSTIEIVCKLIEFHDYKLSNTKKSIRKFLNKFDDERIDLLLELKKADILGQNPEYNDRLEEIKDIKSLLEEILNEGSCFSLKHLKINGTDLISLNIKSGKLIGEILNDCLNNVIEGTLTNDKNELIEYVKDTYLDRKE